MSVDGQVLGAGTIGGVGGGAVSTLTNTGSPILVALVVGVIIVLIAGFTARRASK